MTCKIYTILAFICFIQAVRADAEIIVPIKEYTKTITESFNIASDGTVEISNKYGNVDIETVSGNSVQFRIEIHVEAGNQDRADDLLDRIDIDFTSSTNRVEAATRLNNDKWKRKEKFRINYTVSLPRTNKVVIEQRYGDIAMTELDNDAEINLKYGSVNLQGVGGDLSLNMAYVKSFSMDDVTGDLDVKSSYSNFVIGDSRSVTIETKYSSFKFDRIEEANIQSSYDNFDITYCGRLVNKGKYDEFVIDEAGHIDIKTKYSRLKIGSLQKTGLLETGYGSVQINDLSGSFESLTFESNYTGYDIGFQDAFQLDIDTKYTGVSVPDNMQISERIKDSNELSLRGYYRRASSGMIRANMRYGHLHMGKR